MNNNDHTIYYNSKKEEVPSCTTILKVFGKNLTGWANWLGFKRINVEEYVQHKADIGTYVHSIAEKYFKNETVPEYADLKYISQLEYNKLLAKFNWLSATLKESGYLIYASELEMHGERYGGTADLIFYNKEKDRYLLLDFKTSKAVRRTMFMQLAGYSQLLKETKDINIDAVGIILIMKDVEDKDFLTMITSEQNKDNLEIFNKLLDIYYLLDDKDRKSL